MAAPNGRALIVGSRNPDWPVRLSSFAAEVRSATLDSLEPQSADLLLVIGELAEADDPALAAFILRHALKPGGRMLGAVAGNRSVERMRQAFLDAERAEGQVARRFHPLPDAASLGALLAGAGLTEVVIDVDMVKARYGELPALVRDLRTMGCTNSLAGPIPGLSKKVYRRACELFAPDGSRVEETFEILHFSAVAPIAV